MQFKNNLKNALLAGLFLFSFGLGGCSSGDDSTGSEFDKAFDVQAGNVERNTSPDVSSANIDTCVAGNTQFAMDLYGRLAAESADNLFYSPYSISIALSMAYGGAEGETEAQMKSTLHFNLSEPGLYESFNALDLALACRGKGAEGTDGEPFELHMVNDTWGQKDYAFLDDYLNLLSGYYGADLKTLDFATDPDGAREVINAYVCGETNDRIDNLLPEESIKTLTRLVLTNAIYFNAAWATPFEEDSTESESFTSLDGSERPVPTMHQTEYMPYMAGDGFEAVSLNYDGGEISMVLILPAEGTFTEFENSLSVSLLDSVFDGLAENNVALSLPLFEYDTHVSLKDQLIALGMEAPFDQSADFSGMDGTMGLYIDDVFHKAFVKVNENGTEAAAATAVVVAFKGGMSESTIEMRFNRPFFFVIRDNLTSTILFAGRVVTL